MAARRSLRLWFLSQPVPAPVPPAASCWEGGTCSPARGAGCHGPALCLSCRSQLMSYLHSIASNSMHLQQHMTYICTKKHSFRGDGDPELLPGSHCHGSNWEEANNPPVAPISSSDRKGVSVPLTGCSHVPPQFWGGLTSIWTMGTCHLHTAQCYKAHDTAGEQLLTQAGSCLDREAFNLLTATGQCSLYRGAASAISLPPLHVFYPSKFISSHPGHQGLTPAHSGGLWRGGRKGTGDITGGTRACNAWWPAGKDLDY